MSEFDAHETANLVAQAVANMQQMIAPIEEAARGHRKYLEEQGWSPTAAEHMALQLHNMLMSQFFAMQTGTP